MSRPLKASLAVLIIITISSVFLRHEGGAALKLVKAAETQTPTHVQIPGDSAHAQLRKLLIERKQILDRIVEELEVRLKHGVGTISEYGQAKKTALLAGLDLCSTKSERIEIHKEVVRLYVELEHNSKRRAEAGVGQGELDLVRVARLEAEIALLREQLK